VGLYCEKAIYFPHTTLPASPTNTENNTLFQLEVTNTGRILDAWNTKNFPLQFSVKQTPNNGKRE